MIATRNISQFQSYLMVEETETKVENQSPPIHSFPDTGWGYKINGYVAGLDLLKSTSNNKSNFVSYIFRGCSVTHACGGGCACRGRVRGGGVRVGEGMHMCAGWTVSSGEVLVGSLHYRWLIVITVGNGAFKEAMKSMRSSERAPIQRGGVLLRRRGNGTQTQRKPLGDRRGAAYNLKLKLGDCKKPPAALRAAREQITVA